MPVWGFFLIFFSQVEHFTCLSWKQKLFMYNGQSSLGFSHTRHSPHWSWEQTFMYKAAWFFPTHGIHLICPGSSHLRTKQPGFSPHKAFTWSVLTTKSVTPTAAFFFFLQVEHSPYLAVKVMPIAAGGFLQVRHSPDQCWVQSPVSYTHLTLPTMAVV